VSAHGWRDGWEGSTTGLLEFGILRSGFHGTRGEAGGDRFEGLLRRTKSVHRCTHHAFGVVAREHGSRCHVFQARNGDHGTANATVFLCACSGTGVEHIHDDTGKPVAVFNELAIAVKTEGLEQEPEAGLDEDLISIEAEREAQFTLVEKLHNLDNVLAGVADGNHCRRALVAKVGNDGRPIDERSNVMVCQGL
jgi:hypothetical protein